MKLLKKIHDYIFPPSSHAKKVFDNENELRQALEFFKANPEETMFFTQRGEFFMNVKHLSSHQQKLTKLRYGIKGVETQ